MGAFGAKPDAPGMDDGQVDSVRVAAGCFIFPERRVHGLLLYEVEIPQNCRRVSEDGSDPPSQEDDGDDYDEEDDLEEARSGAWTLSEVC